MKTSIVSTFNLGDWDDLNRHTNTSTLICNKCGFSCSTSCSKWDFLWYCGSSVGISLVAGAGILICLQMNNINVEGSNNNINVETEEMSQANNSATIYISLLIGLVCVCFTSVLWYLKH